MAAGEGYEESAHLYDLFDDKENTSFFLKYASAAGRVLDVGAGTGRIAFPLARRGVRLTCIEPSAGMRREFLAKLDAEPGLRNKIEVIEGTAAGFRLGVRFPLAILSGCFDHFVDDDERLKSLGNIGAHLEPGGRLLFDSFLGLMESSPVKPAGEVSRGDFVYKRLVGGEVLPDGTRDTVLVFETYRDDVLVERLEVHSLVGITTREHIREVLEKSGFRLENEFGDYAFSPYEAQGLLVVEAVKI